MELIQEGCSVAADAADAIGRGLEAMEVQDVKVVATTNFVNAIAALTGNSAYSSERGGGVVAAKTVTVPDGSVVVLNYEMLSESSTSLIERIVAHEAGHVIINRRGNEETAGFRDQNESDWQWWLKILGAQAIVEHRIERAVVELGYPAGESAEVSSVDDALRITNVEVVAAVLDPASVDPGHMQNKVLSTLNHITKLLAYTAAPIVVNMTDFESAQLSLEGRSNWDDYIAPTWQRRIELWGQVPSLSTLISDDSWKKILREAREIEVDFLLDFGFKFEDAPNGGYGFYRVAGEEEFTERLQRAYAQDAV